MDDMRVEFPVTDTVSVTVTRPTEGQMLALALSRKPEAREDQMRLVKRLARILEALMGQEQWDDVFEGKMIAGEIPAQALGDLAHDILTFDWVKAADPDPLQDALDREEARQSGVPAVVPTRPAPRIVSGG